MKLTEENLDYPDCRSPRDDSPAGSSPRIDALVKQRQAERAAKAAAALSDQPQDNS